MSDLRDISELIREQQAEINQLRAELQNRDDWHRAVMAEDCDDDEKHCTCVPLLRAEIKELRSDLHEWRDECDWLRRKLAVYEGPISAGEDDE